MSRTPTLLRLGVRVWALGVIASGSGVAPLVAQDPDIARSQQAIEDRLAVLETVRELFRALEMRDLTRIEALHLPQAMTVSVRIPDEPMGPTVRTLPELLESIAVVTVPMTERIWDPEVRVAGDIASVWTPYDFYIDDSFSHCGHDAFQLVRVEDRWLISAAAYTVARPPNCRLHPAGPPRAATGNP